jgi:DNA-binding transcriptional MerR regulator
VQEHYSTAEVATATGLTQTTLLLWIRNKVIDGSRIRRSREGRRLWTREDIEDILRIKSDNGWI